jgi:hypothetical protein
MVSYTFRVKGQVESIRERKGRHGPNTHKKEKQKTILPLGRVEHSKRAKMKP